MTLKSDHSFLGTYENNPADYFSQIADDLKTTDGLIFLDANILLDLNRPMPNGRPALELLMAQAEKMNARFVVTNLVAQHELTGRVTNPDNPAESVKTNEYDHPTIEKFLGYFSKATLNSEGKIEVTEQNHPKFLLLDTPQGTDQLRMIYSDAARNQQHLHHGKNYGEEDIIDAIQSLSGENESVSMSPVFAISRDNYLRNAVGEGLANAQGFKVGFSGTDGLVNAFLGKDNVGALAKTYREIYGDELGQITKPNDFLDNLASAKDYDINENQPQITRTTSTLNPDNTLRYKASIGADLTRNQIIHPVDLESVFNGKARAQQAIAARNILAIDNQIQGLGEIAKTEVNEGLEEGILQYAERENVTQLRVRKDSKYQILEQAIEHALQKTPPITEIVVMDRRATDLFNTYRDEQGEATYFDLIHTINKVPGILILPSDIDFDSHNSPEIFNHLEKIKDEIGNAAKLTLMSDEILGFHNEIDDSRVHQKSFQNVERCTSYSFVQQLVKNAQIRDNLENLLALDGRPPSQLRGMHQDVLMRRGKSRPQGAAEEKFTHQPPLRWLFRESAYPVQDHDYYYSPEPQTMSAPSRITAMIQQSELYTIGETLKDAKRRGTGHSSNLLKKPNIASYIDWLVELRQGKTIPWDAMAYLASSGTIRKLQKAGRISEETIRANLERPIVPAAPNPLPDAIIQDPIPVLIEEEVTMTARDTEITVNMTQQYGEVADQILKLTEEKARVQFGHAVDDLRESKNYSYETLASELNQKSTIKLTVAEDDVFNWAFGDSLPDKNEFAALQQVLIEENNSIENKQETSEQLKDLYNAALAEMGLAPEATKAEIAKAFKTPENKSAAQEFGKKLARLKTRFSDASLANDLNHCTRRIKDASLPETFDAAYVKDIIRGKQEVTPALSALLTQVLGGEIAEAYQNYKGTVKAKAEDLEAQKPNFITNIVASGPNSLAEETANHLLPIVELRAKILAGLPTLHELQKNGFKQFLADEDSTITRDTFNLALTTLLRDPVAHDMPTYSEKDKTVLAKMIEDTIPKHSPKSNLQEDIMTLFTLIEKEASRQKTAGVFIA